MGSQYIYTMKGLSKAYPQAQAVLSDIWLSFLPGAKIGVLGLNGAGKSTLLRIMAGEVTEFDGEAFPAAGVSVGYLSQEPQLDASKTVAGNVEEGVGPLRDLLRRYDDATASLSSGLLDLEPALEEQGRLQDEIEAAGARDLDSRVAMAMDALRLPPGETDVTTLSGGERRRVALCQLLLKAPDLLLLDEPTNHLDAETVGAVYDAISRRLAEDAEPGEPLPEERAEAMHAKGRLDEGAVNKALGKGDRGFVIAALALASGLSRPAVQKVVSMASAKGIVAVVWRAGFSMGLAEQLQLRLGRISPDAMMRAGRRGGFPISDEELDWQIEFFAS